MSRGIFDYLRKIPHEQFFTYETNYRNSIPTPIID